MHNLERRRLQGTQQAGAAARPHDCLAYTLCQYACANRKAVTGDTLHILHQVGRETLGVDLEPAQLHNMMKRACDVLDLAQPRLTLDDFSRLVHNYCG